MRVIRIVASISVPVLVLVISPSGGRTAEPEPESAESQQQSQQPPPQPGQRGEAQPKPSAAAADVPIYKPPLRGAPRGRVGGGTRGDRREMFVLSVLAPDHPGLTVSEQPTLYWFISRQTSAPVELTVVDPRAAEPVLEARVSPPVSPGVHRLSLADHGVRLSPAVPYRWFVAVVADPAHRSKDILAGGTIERVDVPAGLGAKLARAPKAELAFDYAEAGLWYDALAAISDLVEHAPNDQRLRSQRAALMVQVGLPEVAAWEAKGN
jgi:uncharacterized protein DUF928